MCYNKYIIIKGAIKLNKSFYDLLNMKGKNSIWKSVFVTGRKTYEGFPIVEVEAYDQTFLNAVKTVKKYDETLDRIIKKVYDYFNGEEVWLSVYTDEYGGIEILLNEYYMNEFIY